MSSINEATSIRSETLTLETRAPSVDSKGLAAISRLAEQQIAVPTHPDFASELQKRLASRTVVQSSAVVEKVSAVVQPTVVAPKTQSPRLHPAEALRLVFEPYNQALAEAGAALRASQKRQ